MLIKLIIMIEVSCDHDPTISNIFFFLENGKLQKAFYKHHFPSNYICLVKKKKVTLMPVNAELQAKTY